MAGDGVTGHPKLAVTLLAAALSERARLTPPLAELAMEASRAEALAADRVAGGAMLTLARLLAASPMEAGGTG